MKCELYNDSMQNWKKYPIKKAQLVIADVPYNVGNNFYGSNPMWYKGGDNKNGESKLAGTPTQNISVGPLGETPEHTSCTWKKSNSKVLPCRIRLYER